jgi:hypothetical protein
MNSAFQDLYSIMKHQEGDKTPEKQHPAFTTFKYRKNEGWVKKTVDYIFIGKNQYMKKSGVVVEEFMDPADI